MNTATSARREQPNFAEAVAEMAAGCRPHGGGRHHVVRAGSEPAREA